MKTIYLCNQKCLQNKFTLVELVFCMVTFFILTLLVCSAGEVAKQDAKLTICASNLRKLYTMLQQYDTDHGQLPPVWVQAKPLWYFWSKHIDPSPMRNPVFSCPADPRTAHMYQDVDPLRAEIRMASTHSYGMNINFHTYNPKSPKTLKREFAHPEKLILLGDGIGPLLMISKNRFGIPRHNNFYHYISVSGSQRLLKAEDLGTVKKSILTDHKKEDWNLL